MTKRRDYRTTAFPVASSATKIARALSVSSASSQACEAKVD
jgi:hypothetical protein